MSRLKVRRRHDSEIESDSESDSNFQENEDNSKYHNPPNCNNNYLGAESGIIRKIQSWQNDVNDNDYNDAVHYSFDHSSFGDEETQREMVTPSQVKSGTKIDSSAATSGPSMVS